MKIVNKMSIDPRRPAIRSRMVYKQVLQIQNKHVINLNT